MQPTTTKYRFVDAIPDQIEEGTIYISLEYRTVMHKCLCGCGHEVVTPLGPTDWKLIYDGVSISLHPSVGNWSLSCRSHYWIDRNKVKWAGEWSDAEVAKGRAYDRSLKQSHYAPRTSPIADSPPQSDLQTEERKGVRAWIRKWISW